MSLITCELRFENSLPFYRPGELIKGLVVVTVPDNNSFLIKGLSILFAGYAFCKWEKSQTAKELAKQKPKEIYENREDYVSTTNFLFGSDNANPASIQPGVYSYNFNVHMPLNAPSTFESSLGSIRYNLEVYAHFSGYNERLISHELKVEKLKDLRQMTDIEQTKLERNVVERISRLTFWKHPLQLYVCVPQMAYAVGECISIHIKISNYSKLKMKDITTKLKRIAYYQGYIKEKKPKTITDTKTIDCNVHSLVGLNSSVIQYSQQFNVPKTPPSQNFSECRCISLSYEVEVIVAAQKRERTVHAVLPIIVGSIPLNSEVKLIESHNIDNERVPTISVARSMDDLNMPSKLDMEEQSNLTWHQTSQMSVSMLSLTSTFKDAEYMTPVKLNKKSKGKRAGGSSDFKPQYLYYDMQDDIQPMAFEDLPSCSNNVPHRTMNRIDEL